jgi:hypothetical protein
VDGGRIRNAAAAPLRSGVQNSLPVLQYVENLLKSFYFDRTRPAALCSSPVRKIFWRVPDDENRTRKPFLEVPKQHANCHDQKGRAVSAAAAVPSRLPGQVVAIPRVFIRNQALLVPAELRFATLLFDRMEGEERFVPMSDKEWTRFSGLDPRSKELAIKGLTTKRLLVVEGKGEKARFSSDVRGFMRWAGEVDRSLKPRTAGRAVTVKKAVMHPECAGSGCAMLRQNAVTDQRYETGFVKPGLFVLPNPAAQVSCAATNVPEFAKPVSQTSESSAAAPVPVNRGSDTRRPRHLKRRLRAQNPPAKEFLHPNTEASSRVGPVNAGTSGQEGRRVVDPPVSPKSDAEKAAAEWPLTFARLRAVVPGIDALFLLRLLAIVRATYSGVNDAELAAAAEQAWRSKSGYQKGAGLFLDTIPQALAALRARGEARAGPPGSDGSKTSVPSKETKPGASVEECHKIYQEILQQEAAAKKPN